MIRNIILIAHATWNKIKYVSIGFVRFLEIQACFKLGLISVLHAIAIVSC